MPDFNPDKERHHRHKFIVQKAFPTPGRPGDGMADPVATSKGMLTPDHQGRMIIKDESLAREVQQENPRELVVTRMNSDDPADKGHNYFFTVPELPWKQRQHREAEAQEDEQSQDESPAEDNIQEV